MAAKGKNRASNKNVLPNTYIPVLSKRVLTNVLSRVPKASLVELMGLWPRLVATQPQLDKENTSHNQHEYNQRVLQETREIKEASARWPKRKVIDKVLFEHWSKGLNLLQLSQVDCQLIVDRPGAFYWVSSTVRDGKDREVPISLDPKKFLHSLTKDLSTLFIANIYVCRHPKLPLIIIRIQVFDLSPVSLTHKSNRPYISSHKPYFVAIPLNSPHIIHSPGDDMITNIVLQAVERSLPQDPMNLLRLVTPRDQKPIRSLESMHILKGSSRFGSSLGVWAVYADGAADMLPLQQIQKHVTLDGDPTQEPVHPDSEESPEMIKLKKLANLRFKGTSSGKFKSKKLYDDTRLQKPRRTSKKASGLPENADSDSDSSDEDEKRSDFASIAPIQYAEFTIKEPVTDPGPNAGELEEDEFSGIKLKLTGTDVFAGLHELSVLTTNKEDAIIHPTTIPGWLTGEEGRSCGEIKNGRFIPTN